ncbi:hypothetical protein TTHERM_01114210, partial (macronuclear) [Tetrahymena thermophila SB210]
MIQLFEVKTQISSIKRHLSPNTPSKNQCIDGGQFLDLDCINQIGYDYSKKCTSASQFSSGCCITTSSNPSDAYCLNDHNFCVKFDINSMKNTCIQNGECIQFNPQSQMTFIAVDITGLCINTLPSKNYIKQCIQPDKYCISSDKSNCLSLQNNPNLIGINQTLGVCIQNIHEIIPAGQKISLQNGYCLDPQKNSVESAFTPTYIGIDQSFYCVFPNQRSSDNIKSCIQGYCSNSNYCLQLSDLSNQFTSRLDDANNNKCDFNNTPNATQCSKEKNSCFDSVSQQCKSIQGNQIQFSGVDTNGNCVQLDTFVPNLFKCGSQFCIITSSNMKKCTFISGSSSTMGVDALGFCVNSDSPAVKCADVPQICYDQSNQCCFFLSSNILDKRVGKEQLTGYCLPFKDPTKTTGNQIERCADGFCLYTLSSTSQQFCIILGFSVGKMQYVGIEQNTQSCLALNQTTKIGIIECYSILICIQYDSSNLNYQCTKITNSNQNLVSKNANQTCQQYNQ